MACDGFEVVFRAALFVLIGEVELEKDLGIEGRHTHGCLVTWYLPIYDPGYNIIAMAQVES